MKKICIVTATRAEFGLLLPIIRGLNKLDNLIVQVVVTGTHLSPEHGMTIDEILDEHVEVYRKIDIMTEGDTPCDISNSIAKALTGFAEYYAEEKPDALMVLGDRYELLGICIAAVNERIPIFHLYGGETTEGAVDEMVRHAITKFSYLHFTSTEAYRKRVIQLGEDPSRVFYVGSTGIDNIMNTDFMSKEEIEESLGISLGAKYAVATFHPVTLEMQTAEWQIHELLEAVKATPDIFFLFTRANSDSDGRLINSILEKESENIANMHLVDSLGMRRYLSAIRGAEFVIGNSSSGLSEVPAFRIPTVNIGDRQKGRLIAKSVICCEPEKNAIVDSINKALDGEFKKSIADMMPIHGDGHSTEKIVELVYKFLFCEEINIKKKFYDIEFED